MHGYASLKLLSFFQLPKSRKLFLWCVVLYTLILCHVSSDCIAAAHCHRQYSKLDPQWMILYVRINVYTHIYSASLHMRVCVYVYVYTQIETVLFVRGVCQCEAFFNTWKQSEIIIALILQYQSVLLFIAINLHWLCFYNKIFCDFFQVFTLRILRDNNVIFTPY